jgi:cysteine dioxygenase
MSDVQQFLSMLDAYGERIPLPELEEKLRELDLDFEQVEELALFSDETYRRNLLREGPAYQALILCWLPGQESPLHDHLGSSCGMRVIRGVCSEEFYDRADDGSLEQIFAREHAQGCVCGAQDENIHVIANRQGEPLVTLHVYSPPLRRMNTYGLDGALLGVQPVATG